MLPVCTLIGAEIRPSQRLELAEHAHQLLGMARIARPALDRKPCVTKYHRMDIFSYLIPVSLFAVTAVLAVGLYALFRGGSFGRSYSNRLMRLRVLAQAVAIAVLMGAVWWRTRH